MMLLSKKKLVAFWDGINRNIVCKKDLGSNYAAPLELMRFLAGALSLA